MPTFSLRKAFLLSAVMGGFLSSADDAVAQSARVAAEKDNGESNSEIVVTASLRSEKLQSVPFSITAKTGENLTEMGALDLNDYARSVPGVAIRDTGTGTQSIAVRGINPSIGEAAVSFYIGDTPLPATVGNYGGTLINPKIVDVDRIEVLRGPQGTLYGAGSAGGTVRMIPQAPQLDRIAGYVQAQGTVTKGGYAGGDLAGALNLPIVDGLAAMRTSAWYDNDQGFIHRIYPGGSKLVGNDKTYGVRSIFLLKPNDHFDITAMIYHQNETSNGFQDITGGATNPDDRLVQINTLDIAEPNTNRFTLGSLTANVTIGPIRLTSISSLFRGYRSFTEEGASSTEALAGGPPFFAEIVESAWTHRFTEELRLATIHPVAGFDVIGGFFYNRTRDDRGQGFPTANWNATFAPDGPNDPLYAVDNLVYHFTESEFSHESSFFGELSYHITDKLKLTGGARHFDISNGQSETISGFYNGNVTTFIDPHGHFQGNLYKGSLSYQLTSDHLLYALYSEGFRPGLGVTPLPSLCSADLASLGFASPPTSVNPDYVKNYELGTKTSWLDHKLVVNFAGYRMDWVGLQSARLLQCGYSLIVNSATGARSQGAEAEVSIRFGHGWSFAANGSYTRAKFLGAEPSLGALPGDQIADVPKWQASTQVDYRTAINASWHAIAHLDLQYVSKSYASYDRLASGVRDPMSLLGANKQIGTRLTIANRDWEFAAFVKNLLNDVERQDLQVSAIFDTPGRPRYAVNRPRTVGLSVRRNF